MAIRFTMPGSDMMQRAISAAERGSLAAQKGAIRDTARWAGRRSARLLARQNRIPLRVLRNRPEGSREGQAGRVRWSIGADRANVWVGTRPFAASHLGQPEVMERPPGVSVGSRDKQRNFRGSFLARMRGARGGGHLGIFNRVEPGMRRTAGRPRTSSPNLPIAEKLIHLKHATQVESRVGRIIPRTYRETLRKAVNREQQKWERKFGGVR